MKQIRWERPEFTHYYYFAVAICIGILIVRWPYLDDTTVRAEEKVANFNINKVALKANVGIAKKFFKKVTFISNTKPFEIIYGNEQLGFFKTTDFSWIDSKVQMQMIPPTYKYPIEYWVKGKKVYQKKFEKFRPEFFKEIDINVAGKFNAPFFAITGIMQVGEYDEFERAVFPMVINKFGEIIWAHIPDKGDRNYKKYLTMHMIDENKMATLYSEQSSYFEIIDLKGERLHDFSGKKQNPPLVIHHDFHWNKEDQSLTTFSNELGFLRAFHFDHNILQNLFDLAARPISFVSSSLVKINLTTNNVENLMNGYDKFPHFKGELTDYIISHLAPIDSSVWATWGRRVQYDHLHANSIQKTKEGWLISYRNHNKVVMMDDKFENILWTLGNDSTNDYIPYGAKHRFYHQHHVSMLSNGDILLVDNHPSPPAPSAIGSRVLKIRRIKNGKFKVIWNYQPTYNFMTQTRGSAYQLNNYNILTFYPESIDGADQLVEVDLATGIPVAHMEVSFYKTKKNISRKQGEKFSKIGIMIPDVVKQGGGNRAVPLYDFNSKYIGWHSD